MEAEKNRLNMFGIGGEPLKGGAEWQAGGTVLIKNDSEVDWKDARVVLNKGIVAQRYEVTVPSDLAIKAGGSFFIKCGQFKKSNGDVYKPENGKPHTITIEVALPEGKKGVLEVQSGDKKL